MNKFNRKLIYFGCWQSLAMAIYHFFIPFQFQWHNYITDTSPTINWSLYALNNYFSFNLFVVAILLLFHLKFRSDKIYTIKVLVVCILAFWIFSAIYQFILPMPLPKRLLWLQIALPAIALFNTTLLGLPLLLDKNRE